MLVRCQLPNKEIHVAFDCVFDVVEHPIGFMYPVEFGGAVEEVVLNGFHWLAEEAAEHRTFIRSIQKLECLSQLSLHAHIVS